MTKCDRIECNEVPCTAQCEVLCRMDPVQRYRSVQSLGAAIRASDEARRKRWEQILRDNPPQGFARLPSDDTEGGEP